MSLENKTILQETFGITDSVDINDTNDHAVTNDTNDVISCPFNLTNALETYNLALISIKNNYLSWLSILIAVFVISYPDYPNGIITFLLMIIFAYLIHYYSHKYRNIFTIAHHYHHEHNNFLSHFIQILLEYSIILCFAPFYFIYGKIFFNEWTILFFFIFYSTIHNINYSILRVNNVHYLHHQSILSNIGPDICDIIFGTKNEKDTSAENTNHYIPNIIIGTIVILFLQYLYKSDKNKGVMELLLKSSLFLCIAIVAITSIYIWFYLR